MALAIRTSGSLSGMRGSIFGVYDPTDTNPAFFVSDTHSGSIFGLGLNFAALLDANGLVKAANVNSVNTVPTTITIGSANAFAVGANGVTNPVLNVDSSASTVTTGLNITGAASGSGLALAATSGGANEAVTLDAKGSGAVKLNSVGGTGAVQFGGAAAGANATGITITPNSAASGVAVAVVSTGTNENLTLNAKGSGTITLQGTGTGIVAISHGLTVTGGVITLTANAASAWTTSVGGLTITSAAAATWSTAAGALTLTSAAAATWSTAVGALTLQAAAGLNLTAASASTWGLTGGVSITGAVTLVTSLSMTTTATITMGAGGNIVLDTGTGTKIGTAASQKLGFYNATPVVQQTKAGHNNWAALSDVVSALVTLGLFDTA